METIEKPTATAEAETYAEHKAARTAPPVIEKKVEAAPVEKKEPPEPKAEDKTGADGGEKGGEKERKKSAVPDRIKELTEARKKAEEEREALRKELETLKSAPKTEPKAEPKTETKATPAADESDKPRLKDFVAKLKGDEAYEDAVERHADAVAEWREKRAESKRTAEAAEKESGTAKEQFAGRIKAAREKHEDFEAVTADLAPLMSPAMRQFSAQHPEGIEVAVYLGRNRDEMEAIKKLTPIEQVGMLGAIAARLKSGTQQSATEKKPVSKAPAPPPRIGGAESAPPKDTAEAGSYAEHKRLRTQGR